VFFSPTDSSFLTTRGYPVTLLIPFSRRKHACLVYFPVTGAVPSFSGVVVFASRGVRRVPVPANVRPSRAQGQSRARSMGFSRRNLFSQGIQIRHAIPLIHQALGVLISGGREVAGGRFSHNRWLNFGVFMPFVEASDM